MKGFRTRGIVFIFWILLVMLSAFYIIFSIINFEIVYLFTFIMAFLGLIAAIISIYKMLIDAKISLKFKKEKENHVRDFYRYQQLFNPPDSDMNN